MSWSPAADNHLCRPDVWSRVPTALHRLDSALRREHIRIKVAGRTDNPWRLVLSSTSRRPSLTFLYLSDLAIDSIVLCSRGRGCQSTAAVETSVQQVRGLTMCSRSLNC